jgi:hypothetical protein
MRSTGVPQPWPLKKLKNLSGNLNSYNMQKTLNTWKKSYFLNFFIAFLQSTQDIKRVISKRDGCVYLKQAPSIDSSLELI